MGNTRSKRSTTEKERIDVSIENNESEYAQVSAEERENKQRIADLERKYDDYKNAFLSLSPDDKEYYETPKEYRQYLKDEIGRLSRLAESVTYKSGSIKRHSAELQHAKNALIKYSMVRVFLVLHGSKKVVGVRSIVYQTASDFPLYYEGSTPRNNIFYQGNDLHVTLLAGGVETADLFVNRVLELGALRGVKHTRKQPEETEISIFDVNVVSATMYDTDDEDSARYSTNFSVSSSAHSLIPLTDDLFRYQSFQSEEFVKHHRQSMEKVHLINKSDLKKKKAFVDDDNNKLAMSKSAHHYFDGYRSVKFAPEFSIFVDEDQVDETLPTNPPRKRVNIVFQFHTPERYEVLRHQFKLGSREGSPIDGIPTFHTFVHVTDHRRFINNLSAKHKDNMTYWTLYKENQDDLAANIPASASSA